VDLVSIPQTQRGGRKQAAYDFILLFTYKPGQGFGDFDKCSKDAGEEVK
jgi:hypothetical protein